MKPMVLRYAVILLILSRKVCNSMPADEKVEPRNSNAISPGASSRSSRVNRQNINIEDPGDYDNVVVIDGSRKDVELITPRDNQPKEKPADPKPFPGTYPPRVAPPGFIGSLLSSSSGAMQTGSLGLVRGIGGLVSRILGSSSRPMAPERQARIRRQAEQVMKSIEKSINATKLLRQEQQRQVSQKQVNKSSEEKVSQELTEDSSENQSSSSEEEPPGGGDGMGGGILGLLGGLSGDGGESDLGTLLSVVGSIVANLSGGEGFDLNVLIEAAVTLIAGILAGDGMQNIGTKIGGYVTTVLSGLTGGGAMNNGEFFGNLLASIIAGTSAAGTGDSEEDGGGGGSDSGTFFFTLISSILGASSSG